MVTIQHHRDHWAIKGCKNSQYRGSLEIDPDPRLPRRAQDFWCQTNFPRCNGGVVAQDQGTVVGFCRYDVSNHRINKSSRTLKMAGTWIEAKYRKTGLATKMWRLIFEELSSGTTVYAVVVSRGGQRLVKRLAGLFPALNFDVERSY